MPQALFLGAGFSIEFGMPLVFELTRTLREWLTPQKFVELNTGWRSQGTGHSDRTQQIVVDILGQRDLHYEQLIGAVEVAALRYENRTEMQELHGVRSWLLEIVYHILQLRHAKSESFIRSAISLHKGLRTLAAGSTPLWIFSLNHDLVVEILAAELGIPLRNGFDESDELRLTAPTSQVFHFSRLDMQKPGYPYQYFPHASSGINLLKIHGSLDIFGYDDRKSFLCLRPTAPNVAGYLNPLRDLNELAPGNMMKATNEIIMTDPKGEMQFLRRSLLSGAFKFSRSLSQVVSDKILTLFVGSLNYADELIVIGYGFGDHHINAVIREWLEFSSKRRIIVVDPRREKIPDSLGHLPAQILLEKKSAVEFLSGLPGGELTAAEKTQLELRQRLRTMPPEVAKPLIGGILRMFGRLPPTT